MAIYEKKISRMFLRNTNQDAYKKRRIEFALSKHVQNVLGQQTNQICEISFFEPIK